MNNSTTTTYIVTVTFKKESINFRVQGARLPQLFQLYNGYRDDKKCKAIGIFDANTGEEIVYYEKG